MNIIYGIFASGFVGILVGYFSDKVSYAIIAAVVTFPAYLWVVIISNLITITVSKAHLTVKKGNKEEFFVLEQCGISAETITRNGDTECLLFITDPEGKIHRIDCELIGIDQFEHLMEDLGIIGENAPVQKLNTKKK